MADKEATVYVIDLGESMADCHNGRDESDLDFAMRYVWDKISTTVAASRKTWNVGVVGLNTDKTYNNENEKGLAGYEHISVIQELGSMTMTSLRALQPKIKPSRTSSADAISAIVVAMGMIQVFTKKLKYKRKIILVTNGEAGIDDLQSEDVAAMLNEVGIELVVIGVDFDDAEYGFKEEDKSQQKRDNEKILKTLVDQCENGVFGTMAQAVEELAIPRIKQVRPFKAYDGPLTLGDPAKYESALSIHVERYFKTKRATPPSASNVTTFNGPTQTQGRDEDNDTPMSGVEFQPVKQLRTYRVDDAKAAGGKKDIDSDDLAKGYKYGRTLVPFSESEEAMVKYETVKSFTIIGFVPMSSYEPFVNMGETGLIVAQKLNEEAELGLSALIHALHELESYAVARYVNKDNSQPQILLLKPNPAIEDDVECLYDVPLPFAEDVRSYQFPPLDKVLTITGNVLTEHRLLPNDNLQQAMSDYVDAMDLTDFGQDEDGNAAEYAPIDDNYNPVIHHMNQAIRNRAVNPDAALPPVADILTRFTHPPEALVAKAKSEINGLIEASEVKKVPPRVQGRRGRKETVKPLSGLDIDALLGESRPRTKKTPISTENAIPEFKQILETAEDDDTIENAAKQMGDIIRKLISDSFADVLYPRAAENLRVLREGLINMEVPNLYNKFLTELKGSLLSGELNGDRREMWFRWVVGGRLGLITPDESEVSAVSDVEAKAFLK
ncbi:SPOC like C-terminal domain-containing protein [Sordaria brevicollis]|uniref:ATP-dependent DNA helicase II subunit 2 n=1 Tax=Sordaria brevicollis TaxID=83679 RepID=A0AAE0NV94_SORBR|nr:SPOC like C-terminal domain-containing protein [Sordaria brevicollis]